MRSAAVVLASAVLLAGCASAEPAPAERLQLDGGLTVLLRPVQGTPDVALVVLYAVGGRHDPEGQSGLAHLVEHCYVTAAAGPAPARDIAAYVQRYPKGWNAQTGDDYTVLASVFPAASLDDELRDAAARMGDLRITQADLERETPRMIDELGNMFGGMPALAARNLARERVCPSPRGGRKGGVPDEVRAITPAAAQAHWQRYYKPPSATLVLAGGFDAGAARAAVRKHFGAIPAGEAPPPPPTDAPKPPGGTTETVRAKAIQPGAPAVACLAYAAPAPTSDLYAPFLLVVARLISHGAKPPAGPGEFPVTYAALDDPAVLTVSDRLAPNETPEAAVARLEVMVTEAVRPDLSAADVVAAKNQFGFMLGLAEMPDPVLAQNLYGVAFGIGRRAQMGIDPAALRKAMEAVSATDLRRAAKAVLAKEARAAVVVTEAP